MVFKYSLIIIDAKVNKMNNVFLAKMKESMSISCLLQAAGLTEVYLERKFTQHSAYFTNGGEIRLYIGALVP